MDENEYRWKRPEPEPEKGPDREPPRQSPPKKKPGGAMKKLAWIPFVIVAVIIVSIFLNSFYELKEDEYAVITTFGKPSVVSTSGLKFKWPFIQHKTIVSKATKGFPIGYDMRKTEKRGQVGPRISSSCFHQLYWLFSNPNQAWVKSADAPGGG